MPPDYDTRPWTVDELLATDRFRASIIDTHDGRWRWKNGAELEWECADDCRHPSHGEDH